MTATVCLLADTLGFMSGGGHFWVFLNWALGLRANGCRVHWVEPVPRDVDGEELGRRVQTLRSRLRARGLDESIAVVAWLNEDPDAARPAGCAAFTQIAAAADLAINFAYWMPASVLGQFRRTALVDIDPGLTQFWLSTGQMRVAPHSVYFTTGETVGRSSLIPECGLAWIYTPPCVSLDAWPVTAAADDSPFTTVSGWHADEWIATANACYCNDKRQGFLPFLDLPQLAHQPLELALDIGRGPEADGEWRDLEARGWRIRHSYDVAGTPADYQRYIQGSRGEFSAVKPSCVRLQNAWISDRTLCYLASGKPAIVQHTGPSRILPTSAGLFRFQTLEGAAAMLELAAGDYTHQCQLARALAEENFDANRVTRRLLERALS